MVPLKAANRVLVAWGQPGPWTVFWLAIAVLIAFGVVEALARAAGPREPASQ